MGGNPKHRKILHRDDAAYIRKVAREEYENAHRMTRRTMKSIQTDIGRLSQRISRMENPTDIATQIHNLSVQVSHIEDELKRLAQRIDRLDFHSSPENMENYLPIPLSEKMNIEPYINQAKAQEKENLQEDKNKISAAIKISDFWTKRARMLKEKLQQLNEAGNGRIEKSRTLLESMPEDLQEELRNNQDGLSLIGRMIHRLVDPGDRLDEITVNILFPEKLRELSESEWTELLETERDEENIHKKINKKLNMLGMENYKIVARVAQGAKNREKNLCDFLVRHVLPIIDGVQVGKKHLLERIDELQQKFPDHRTEMTMWFSAYTDLAEKLKDMIESIGVYEMEIEKGEYIDFEKHEPFGVEADPAMKNEQIKEIIRSGYYYKTAEETPRILRTAQVVVIKNTDMT